MSKPPVIGEHVLPTTPAQEWANTTSSSLVKSATRDPTTTASEASTPGPEFPGAFPPQKVTDRTTGSVLDMAKGYIPSQSAVKNAVMNAGETAKQYLPETLASYFPPSTSDEPRAALTNSSTGVRDTQPETRTDAIDTAGQIRQKMAATTPNNSTSAPSNEKRIDTSLMTAHTNPDAQRESISTSYVSTQAQDGSATSMDSQTDTSTPATTEGTERHVKEPLDSVDTPSANPHHSSIGPEIDKVNRNGQVDAASDQSVKGVPIVNTAARTHPLAGPGAKWKGVPLDEPYQRALDADSNRQLNIGAGNTNVSRTKEGQQQVTVADTIKSEAEALKDRVMGPKASDESGTTRQAPLDATTVDSATPDTHSPINHKRDRSTASNAPSPDTPSPKGSKITDTYSRTSGSSKGSGSPHKSSFMDKIKGEVKVISGKLSHDEVKVEEGRRLLGKHV